MEVIIKFNKHYPGKRFLLLERITEIHYKYPSFEPRIAFESDIDGTGYTFKLEDIAEFEANN